MMKQMHPELPNDTELKLPHAHPPKDAAWLKSSLAHRYPQAIDHLMERFSQKKTYNMRGGAKAKKNRLTGNGQTSESGGTNIFSTHTNRSLNHHSTSHHQERQKTNRSSIYQDNSGANSSKLSENPVNAPTADSSQSGRRVEAFRGHMSSAPKKPSQLKKPKLILEDVKALTVTQAKYSHRHELDTNMSYKAMMAGKRELDKHIATSEEKRRKTELGGFVTAVDHSDLAKDTDQLGVSSTLYQTWRIDSGTNKTVASSLGTTTRTHRTANSTRKAQDIQNSFSDCNKLAEQIRSEFFENILSGDYAANETLFGRKFFLAFDWMKRKKYLELDSFDEQTGFVFYNRRNMNQRELEAEKTAQALKTVERSLLRTSGASAKVKLLLAASLDAHNSGNRAGARVSFSVPLSRQPVPPLPTLVGHADKIDPDLEDSLLL